MGDAGVENGRAPVRTDAQPRSTPPADPAEAASADPAIEEDCNVPDEDGGGAVVENGTDTVSTALKEPTKTAPAEAKSAEKRKAKKSLRAREKRKRRKQRDEKECQKNQVSAPPDEPAKNAPSEKTPEANQKAKESTGAKGKREREKKRRAKKRAAAEERREGEVDGGADLRLITRHVASGSMEEIVGTKSKNSRTCLADAIVALLPRERMRQVLQGLYAAMPRKGDTSISDLSEVLKTENIGLCHQPDIKTAKDIFTMRSPVLVKLKLTRKNGDIVNHFASWDGKRYFEQGSFLEVKRGDMSSKEECRAAMGGLYKRRDFASWQIVKTFHVELDEEMDYNHDTLKKWIIKHG